MVNTAANHTPPSRAQHYMTDTTALAARVCAFLLAIYLLTYSGVITISDEVIMMSTAESLAKRGKFTANPTFWKYNLYLFNAEAGDVVPTVEPLQPILSAPLAWLALQLPHVGLIHLTVLFNLGVTVITALVVMSLVCELGYSSRISAACALLYGLCTIAFPYSKVYFREPLAGLFVLIAVWCLARLQSRKNVWYALAGLGVLGVTYFAKEAALLVLPIFGLMAGVMLQAWLPPQLRRRLWQLALVAVVVVSIALGALAVLGLNPDSTVIGQRTLSALRTLPTRFAEYPKIIEAFVGFLVSPGKSFWVFTPLALATLWAFPRFYRAHRHVALLIAGINLSWIGGYALTKYEVWWGGLSWGPRFLVPLAPLVTIPLAPLLAAISQSSARWQRLVFGVIVLVSFYVQLIGVGLDIRVYADGVYAIPGDIRVLPLWDYRYSPPLWNLSTVLRPDNWNFSWARHVWGHEQFALELFDWRILGVALLFVGGSAFFLARAFAQHTAPSRRAALSAWGITLIVSIVASALIVMATHDDPRFFGGDDRRQLLQTIDEQEQPNDVLLLSDNTLTRFVLNYSHASLNWYGVRVEEELSEGSIVLIDSIVKANPRVWLMLNYSPKRPALRTVENYMTTKAYPVQREVFSDYAQLVLYSTVNAPDPLRPQHTTQWRLSDEIELNGFDLSNQHLALTYTRGSYVQLSLLWRALRPLTKNYTVFVQILSPSGQLVWQSDRQPMNGARATSSWKPDEPIRDNYGFVLPEDWAAGSYRVIVGMYEWPSLKRLSVRGAGQPERDYIELGLIVVQ
jgi:hypothetical protein